MTKRARKQRKRAERRRAAPTPPDGRLDAEIRRWETAPTAYRRARVGDLLARLRAAGALAWLDHDGESFVHIPPQHRGSIRDIAVYLAGCLPDGVAPLLPLAAISQELYESYAAKPDPD